MAIGLPFGGTSVSSLARRLRRPTWHMSRTAGDRSREWADAYGGGMLDRLAPLALRFLAGRGEGE